MFSLRWVDKGWKKYDCLVTLSCCLKQNSFPKQVQVYVLLIWFRVQLGKVYHLQVHCCFVSLTTEYNNSANQVNLWFEKQWFRCRPFQRRTLTKSNTHDSVANTCSDPQTQLICLSRKEEINTLQKWWIKLKASSDRK